MGIGPLPIEGFEFNLESTWSEGIHSVMLGSWNETSEGVDFVNFTIDEFHEGIQGAVGGGRGRVIILKC